jgi:hypothetical protein
MNPTPNPNRQPTPLTAIRSDYDFDTTLERLRLKQGTYYKTRVDVDIKQVSDTRASFSVEVSATGYFTATRRIAGIIIQDEVGAVTVKTLEHKSEFPKRILLTIGFVSALCGVGAYILATILFGPPPTIFVILIVVIFGTPFGASWTDYINKRRQFGNVIDLVRKSVAAPQIDKLKNDVTDVEVIHSEFGFEETIERLGLRADKYGRTELHFAHVRYSPEWAEFEMQISVDQNKVGGIGGQIVGMESQQVRVDIWRVLTVWQAGTLFIHLGLVVNLFVLFMLVINGISLVVMFIPLTIWFLTVALAVSVQRRRRITYENLLELIHDTVRPTE